MWFSWFDILLLNHFVLGFGPWMRHKKLLCNNTRRVSPSFYAWNINPVLLTNYECLALLKKK